VPSRQDVEEYQNLRSTVNELVGRINGRFGTIDFMPIHFMHKSLPFDELCALYAISDACLVSSTRDGMNLVSYEYIASQGPGSVPSTPEKGRNGVMILSEFAGAAQSLNGSIVVNPWDPQQVADAIQEALTTDPETREQNHAKLFKVRCPSWPRRDITDVLDCSISRSTARRSGVRASSRSFRVSILRAAPSKLA